MYEDIISFSVSIFLFSATFFLIQYHWKRRWLYYYASKFEAHGATVWPIIGNALSLFGTTEDITFKLSKLVENGPPVFKTWFGPYLVIVNSEPEDIEIILNKYLEKPLLLRHLMYDLSRDGIFLAQYNLWKKNRKIINPTFNYNIMKTFVSTFVKYSNCLVDDLRHESQHTFIDIFPKIFRRLIDTSCETLLDIDAELLNRKHSYISKIVRAEEIIVQRVMQNPLLILNFFWKRSSLNKESQLVIQDIQSFAHKIMQIKKSQQSDNTDIIRKKRFLNHLLNGETKMSDQERLDEIDTMLIASTETSSTSLSFTLLALAILQDVQDKVYEEQCSIFGDSERDVSLEDLNKMDYLERVIKETLRLFPTIMVIARSAHEELKINNYVYPKGSIIMICPYAINRSTRFWKDPLVFNPDRFLSEEVKKLHRCTFIPFSYGSRNCPGILYGMISMKTMLSIFIRNYKVTSCNYQGLEDIKLVFNIMAKPNKGFKITVAKRN